MRTSPRIVLAFAAACCGGSPAAAAEPSGWDPAHRGFVPGLAARRMAVAVAVAADHPHRRPVPELAARLRAADGAVVELAAARADTAAAPRGWRTEAVFEIDRGAVRPGAVVETEVRAGAAVRVETLPLAGLVEAPPLALRWVPVAVFDVPPVDDLGDAGYTDHIGAFLPLADRVVSVAPPLRYAPAADDAPDTVDVLAMFRQLDMLRLERACGPDEVFAGVYPWGALDAAGYEPKAGWVGYGGAGGTMLVGGPLDDRPDAYGPRHVAHEFAHVAGLGHFACPDVPDPGYLEDGYPYPDGALGPARLWDFHARRFVARGDAHDLMTYCHPKGAGDYTYRRVLAHLRAPGRTARFEAMRACLDDRGAAAAAPRSLAVRGTVGADGAAAVTGMRASPLPPWAPPDAAALAPARRWTLELLDGGGAVHRQAVPLERAPSGGDAWGWRVPLPAGVDAAVLRDPSGDLRAAADVRCPGCRDAAR